MRLVSRKNVDHAHRFRELAAAIAAIGARDARFGR